MNLTINKSLYIFVTALSVTLFGCKKQLDINTDPNYPLVNQGSPRLVFPAATMSSVGRIGGDLNIIGGIWSQFFTQSWSSSQYRTIDAYNLQSTDYNGAYSELFSGALNNYQYVLDSAKAQSDWNFYLMGTVMKAYTVQVLADLYDKIPYSQSLQGQANLNPTFDDGYSIYTDLIAKIDDALGKDFTAATVTDPGSSDFVFGGNMTKWKQFANTLKLKIYLRMVNAKPAEAQAGIQKLYTSGAKFLDADAAVTHFTETPDKQNPFYAYNIQRLNTTTNLRASKTFVSWLQANSDPRILYYYGKTNPIVINQGDYLGTDPTYGKATVLIQSATDPVELISVAESYFLQAEARLRYYAGDVTQGLYEQGVEAAFTETGNDGSSFIAPGGAYEYPAAGSMDNKLEAIIVQKWASLAYGAHSLEAFFEKNRTGYPKTSAVYSNVAGYIPGQFVYSPNGVTGGAFPKRLVYPNVERSRNKNTPAEVPITTAVWWAK
ncbi:hypothetical protein A3860_24510 [Niastella vici]|uniref:SusD/RagB family nutrient-binding outer membrane lipoprotein n=1 Tax=Niastella vici TaxID=1703345 RepID=A0A1V9FZ35_9BACT|nr:SusD/RagB family nutrient-binding outer membrane lipoprotein [Niastella vici]OQP63506.1 hypothetical protein A3860_24510 [Niastella vici]